MFELDFRVDYIDTDAMGIVHHSSYCRWLERARVYWLDSLGLNYAKMEAEGYALPLRRLELEYFKPLLFDESAQIRLQVAHSDRFRVNLEYEIHKTHDKTKVLVSRAVTEHVLVRNLKPASIPEEWRNKWQQQKEPKSSTSL